MTKMSLCNFKKCITTEEDLVVREKSLERESRNRTKRKLKYESVLVPNSISNTQSYDRRIPKYNEKGLVIVWPQKRKFYQTKELTKIMWFLAHALYVLHALHLFPSGTAIPLKHPPWSYSPPLRKPENRDYIIEPDWDSYLGN